MRGRRILQAFTSMLTAALLAACGGKNTASDVQAPGNPKSAELKVLEAGAAVMQSKPPIGAINAYLDGFHFYSGGAQPQAQAQMEAHHYCTVLNDDVIQCVIYDANVGDAKLMGVEYIVSARLFAGLPAAEKALWHSHVHEVKSGQLLAPGIPEPAEHALMARLVNTYGKTWHTWHTDLDKQLPLGMPQLMMGFTADGQIDAAMVAARDERLAIDSRQRRQARADIPAPAVDALANGWQHGRAVQIDDPTAAGHRAAGGGSAASSASNGRAGRR